RPGGGSWCYSAPPSARLRCPLAASFSAYPPRPAVPPVPVVVVVPVVVAVRPVVVAAAPPAPVAFDAPATPPGSSLPQALAATKGRATIVRIQYNLRIPHLLLSL